MADGLNRQILTQEQMTDFIREVKTGDRIVSIRGDETDRIVILKKATKQNDTDARVYYAALYSHLLKAGVPTRAEARKDFLMRLKNVGVDTDEYEARRDAIQEKIAKQLQETVSEEQAQDVLQGLPELMRVLDQNLKTLDKDEMALLHTMADNEAMEAQIMTNCAEAMAEAETQLFLLAQIAHNPDGSLVWEDHEALNKETDLTFVLRLREEFTRYRNGFPMLFEVAVPTREDVPNESPSL